MQNIVQMREEVKTIAKKAIDADEKNQVEEACNLYIQAAAKLNQLAKVDENQYNKETYKKRGMDYATRAQDLKKQLSIGSNTSNNNSNSNSNNVSLGNSPEKKQTNNISEESKKSG